MFFIVSLVGIYATVRFVKPLGQHVDRFGAYLTTRAFPSQSAFEVNKFALLRILFGIVLLTRAWHIHAMLLPSEISTPVGILSYINVITCTFVLIGFLTQWSFLTLAFVMWQSAEKVLGTSTLGSDVAAMLSLLLFLVGAGKAISIDALILKRFQKLNPLLLYFQSITPNKIAIAKFLALFAYWALCTYSLAMHINEPAWTTGVVGSLLLTNNFMTTPYAWFEGIFEVSPFAVHLAKYAIWLMMLWYTAVLPFTLLGGYFRKYIILWGVLFFSLSEFVLNLSALPKVEYILWAALFWGSFGINDKKKIEVFFDDKCNLCDKTIQFITAIDLFNRIQLRPVSQNKALLDAYGISEEKALEDLYGVEPTTQKQYSGFNFYLTLSKKLVVLWPLIPILLLGKLTGLGSYIYRKIADKRRELFGVCTLPRPKISRDSNTIHLAIDEPLFNSIFYHVLILGFFFLIAIPAPFIGHEGIQTVASKAAHHYGIAPINVFNITDVRMTENWYTLKNTTTNQIAPIFTPQGTRLEMHKSDRVYYGNTVKFRRKFIGSDGCVFDEAKKSIDYLSKVSLARDHQPKGSYQFHYVQYYQPIPDVSKIMDGIYVKSPTTTICNVDYVVEYKQ